MQRSKWLGPALLAGAALALFGRPAAAHHPHPFSPHGGALITNGTVKLGVDKSANLNIPDAVRSYNGGGVTGVRFIKPGVGELEYTADGCTCEGWGVADASTGLTAYANDAIGYGGYVGGTFTSTATDATAEVETSAGGPQKLRVTHYFHPSPSPNLYQADVTIRNIGTAAIGDLRYRRVMDWDIEPTPFNEFVTIFGGSPRASALFYTSNNGFTSGNPLVNPGNIYPYPPINADFNRAGPADHGAVFDFRFGVLNPGETKVFRVYYGAANTRAAADAVIASVGAEVYSYGEPNVAASHPAFSVAIFAFKGVGASPIANAGPDVTVNCAGSAGTVTLDGRGSTDPNGDPLTYMWYEGTTLLATGPTATITLPSGTHTIRLEVTDPTGLTDSDTLVVTFAPDTVRPSISCPGNATANNAPGTCSATVDPGTATASDNCPGVRVTGVRSDGALLSSPYPVGTTLIIWTATDASGNTTSCSQTVTVRDVEAPGIACPANVSANTDPGRCSAAVSAGAATATDNCPGVTVAAVRSDGRPLADPFPLGSTTITWTATDASGNTSTCSQTVTVTDREAPSIACPGNVTVNNDAGQCSAVVNPGVATAADNCPGATAAGARSDSLALNAPYPVGTTTITWTATDAAGNTSTCTQTVTVKDTEPPVASATNITAGNDPGQCSATVSPSASAADNCPGATVAGVRGDGKPLSDPYPVGVTTITWTATDAAGNTSSVTQTVTVNDVEKPTSNCVPTTNPAGGNVPNAGNNPKSGQNPDGFYQLLATDNCTTSPQIFVQCSVTGFIAGPFAPGDRVKITQAPGVTPNSKPMAGVIKAHIQLKGDALVWSVDAAGNVSPMHLCLVAPKPK